MPGKISYNVPRIILNSGDGKPLLESMHLRLRFEDSNGFVGQDDLIDFIWRGEKFQVRPGKDYHLKPFASSGKISSV